MNTTEPAFEYPTIRKDGEVVFLDRRRQSGAPYSAPVTTALWMSGNWGWTSERVVPAIAV